MCRVQCTTNHGSANHQITPPAFLLDRTVSLMNPATFGPFAVFDVVFADGRVGYRITAGPKLRSDDCRAQAQAINNYSVCLLLSLSG
jgi:hypothetical protein